MTSQHCCPPKLWLSAVLLAARSDNDMTPADDKYLDALEITARCERSGDVLQTSQRLIASMAKCSSLSRSPELRHDD
jgi:hypothetical protein